MPVRPPTESLSSDKGGLRRAQSLRATLALSFIALVLLTATAIAAVSLHNSAQATNELANQLLQQTQINVEQKLGDYLALPHMLNRLNAAELRRNPARLTRLTELRPIYLGQLRAFDPVMTVAVGVEATGEFVGLGRRDGVTYESGLMERRVDTAYRVHLLDSDGNVRGVLSETPNYDARTRPWYQAAVKAGRAAWSPIYVWASHRHVGITAVLPIYDDGGALLGVHQSALSLEYISQFLRSLQIGKSGQIFLMERSGQLIATSAAETPVRSASTDGNLARFHAAESADPFTQAAAEHLVAHFGDLNQLAASYQARPSLAGQPYFLAAVPLRDPYGLDWIVVIGVPEADLLGQAITHTRLTVVLGAAAVLVAAIVGIVIARRFTEPLRQLNAAAKELARGHWDRRIIVKRLDEVGELAHEFNLMADALSEKEAQLRAYAGSLEQRVAERTAALQASEENFRHVVENAPDGIVVAAADGRHLYANRRAIALLGYTAEELARTALRDLAHPDALPMLQQRLQDRIAGRPVPASYETIIRRKDGSGFPAEIAGVRTVWEGQTCDLVFFRDIADRKQAEETLRRANADLKRSNTDLERFAYVASHDLREPLRMVASFVGLLADRYRGQLDADADEFIGFAVDGARRMEHLINDLLEYARISTRGAPLRPTDANAALDDALWNLDLPIRDADALVTHDPLPTVLADPTQLTQLFQNLIGNAIKFHGSEPPRVHVAARPAEDGGATMGDGPHPSGWVFSVRDNGIGIDPKDHERIFGVFQRLHTQEEYPGTGIGLAVCQRIVERHGGRIWVESQPGQGAAFYFTLPASMTTDARTI